MPTANLENKRCIPCEVGAPPLTEEEVSRLRNELQEAWEIVENKKLRHRFKFKDFGDVLRFVNDVGARAEEEGHHPDLALSWGKVGVELYTHSIGGLSENDFILARKIEIIYNQKYLKS